MTLAAALKRVPVSDAELASQCGVHRTMIWRYRVRGQVPDAATAGRVIAALRKHGIDLTLEEALLGRRRSRAA